MRAVLVLDQSGWHDAQAVLVPETNALLPLPPLSPRVNPMARVWQYLRERSLSHRMLADYEAALEAVCRASIRVLDERGCLTILAAYQNLTASGIFCAGITEQESELGAAIA
ncbi:hypothetical protein GGR34_001505 [Microvirga flocculans]|uniref:Tc1-like transposase DDE domain-containing protein n=1 Tax=Microvirga flocculans TaxID=217168 RepID=A0A7W6N7Y6_9HYPH|nr:hypothetical protein [Microvirga flocculans]MBB4039858.1 hypothetical protein [Microvirga flocculans]